MGSGEGEALGGYHGPQTSDAQRLSCVAVAGDSPLAAIELVRRVGQLQGLPLSPRQSLT